MKRLSRGNLKMERDRDTRHTDDEEEELRDQAWEETLVSYQLVWHCNMAGAGQETLVG